MFSDCLSMVGYGTLRKESDVKKKRVIFGLLGIQTRERERERIRQNVVSTLYQNIH